jgi:hypothetical protein
MKFQQRLNRFLIGVLIGIFFVIYLFRDREWGRWTPENMVLGQLQSYRVEPDSLIQCRIQCLDIDSLDFDILYEDGDVRISESEPRANPRKYKIYSSTNDSRDFYIVATIQLEPDRSQIIEIGLLENEPNCDCP